MRLNNKKNNAIGLYDIPRIKGNRDIRFPLIGVAKINLIQGKFANRGFYVRN